MDIFRRESPVNFLYPIYEEFDNRNERISFLNIENNYTHVPSTGYIVLCLQKNYKYQQKYSTPFYTGR